MSFIISAGIPFVIGYLWYHPKVFGASLEHIEMDRSNQSVALRYLMGVLAALGISLFFLLFNNDVGQEGEFDNFLHGMWHGLFAAMLIALPVTILMSIIISMNWKSLFAHLGYWLITFALMGGVMDALNHFNN